MLTAVEVRTKRCALLVHPPSLRQAEHLIPAAVGQYWFLPADEGVQTPECGDACRAGTQVQMIRIREDDLGSNIVEVAMRDRLHRTLRADSHECRRIDDAVRGRQH